MLSQLVRKLSVFDYYYYNKRNECQAKQCTDEKCICWYKEGTGPNADVEKPSYLIIDHGFGKRWSTKKLTWKKKLNMVKVNIYIIVLFIPPIIFSYV